MEANEKNVELLKMLKIKNKELDYKKGQIE